MGDLLSLAARVENSPGRAKKLTGLWRASSAGSASSLAIRATGMGLDRA